METMDREQIVRLCDENNIRVLTEEDGFRFRELTHGYRYGLSMTEYPGSADDAAGQNSPCGRSFTAR